MTKRFGKILLAATAAASVAAATAWYLLRKQDSCEDECCSHPEDETSPEDDITPLSEENTMRNYVSLNKEASSADTPETVQSPLAVEPVVVAEPASPVEPAVTPEPTAPVEPVVATEPTAPVEPMVYTRPVLHTEPEPVFTATGVHAHLGDLADGVSETIEEIEEFFDEEDDIPTSL